MPRPSLFLLLLTLVPAAIAQQPQPTGTVTGHVFCADTHLPARLASVYLQPLPEPDASAKSGNNHNSPTQLLNMVRTVLDGSFTIPNVRPGDYYVIAEYPGYLSPVSELSRESLAHPDKITLNLMADLLTPVTVVGNKVSTSQVGLFKAASISGYVRFDDGSPSVNMPISFLRLGPAGKWVPFHKVTNSRTNTDDRGFFRAAGFPPGKYLVEASLEVEDVLTASIFDSGGPAADYPSYSLTLFSGGVTRQRDAKPIEVTLGEEITLPDLEIPLSKLHTITGTLLTSDGGVPLNGGTVSLIYPDDKTELTSTTVSRDDDNFHFPWIPEGAYILKVTNAREVSRTQVPICDRCMPPTGTEEKTLRTFGDTQQPLVIQNDITGLTVSIPPTPTAKSNPTTSAASN